MNIVICKKKNDPPPVLPFVKTLISIIEKKLNEKDVDFHFRMSTVPVIFLFF